MKKLKQKLKNRMLRYLFNMVTIDQIYTYNARGKHFIGGQELTIGEVKAIGQEIRDFRASRLYKILYSTVKHKAEQSLFVKGVTVDDFFAGKMTLLALDTQNKIMDKISASYEKQIRDK